MIYLEYTEKYITAYIQTYWNHDQCNKKSNMKHNNCKGILILKLHVVYIVVSIEC